MDAARIAEFAVFDLLLNGDDERDGSSKWIKQSFMRERLTLGWGTITLILCEAVFSTSHFFRPLDGLIRATNAATTCFRYAAYNGHSYAVSRQKTGSKMCKVEPPLYTDFTPAVRTKTTMRSIIGAVI